MNYKIGDKFKDTDAQVVWEIKEIDASLVKMAAQDPDIGELAFSASLSYLYFQVENGNMIPVVDTGVDNEDHLEAYKAFGFTASNWDTAAKTVDLEKLEERAVAKATALGTDYATNDIQSELLKIGNRVVSGEVKATITNIDFTAKEVTIQPDDYDNEIGWTFDFFKEYFKLIEPYKSTINEEAAGMFREYDALWSKEGVIVLRYNAGCNHSYKRYEGFTETYDYCTLCNKKRGE